MNVGLMTFHAAHHYGTMLQAYALAKTAADIAGGCEIIDYRRPDMAEGNAIFQRGLRPLVVLRNIHSLLYYPSFRRRFDRHEAFLSEAMPLGPALHTGYDQLEAEPPAYDRLLCGGQTRNPLVSSGRRFDPAYVCAFSGAADKIAYGLNAASGKGKNASKLREQLTGFSHLSARDMQGSEALARITEKPVPAVLDPTLLLNSDDWAGLAAPNEYALPYILCYFVSPPGPLAKLIPGIKHQLGIRAVQLAGIRCKSRGVNKIVFDAGPREFLALFQNATFVLTNAFHGTVFSLLFQRPFLYGAGSGEDGGAERTGALLQSLGLSRRLVSGGSASALMDIDFVPITRRLQAERERSMAYLKTALKGCNADI